MTNQTIHIIGGGISGLHAAYLLEQKGFQPIIWESTDRVGGRMKTDIIDGYQLDRGFQVMLDQYPLMKEHLDLQALELQTLLPGSMIVKDGNFHKWGDPLRNFSVFWNSIFSSLGSLNDKWTLFQLRNSLQAQELNDHFKEERSTLNYLKDMGFSSEIIHNFFKPFFSGIFLESELNTSAAMFRFVFSLFSKGNAVIPKAGIEAIPKQLLAKLKNTQIHYNTKIDKVESGRIMIDGVDKIQSEHTLICTEPSSLVRQLDSNSVEWNSLDTFYYEVDRDVFKLPIIGLFPDSTYVNHVYFPQSVQTATKGAKELVSVNVVRDLNDSEYSMVEEEILKLLSLSNAKLIKHYSIKQALPKFDRMQYQANKEESLLIDGVYLAGDQQLNPSQNAALASAEAAVACILEKIEMKK